MIDLHCHLLPGVDDGPDTLEKSIAMGRAAYEDGVLAIVVTPHSTEWERMHPGEDAREALEEEIRWLEQALHEAGVPLTLYAGLEVYLDLDLGERLRQGRGARSLGQSPYVLLELPFFQRSLYVEQVIFEIQLQGWRPLLSHPERYVYVQREPDIVTSLVQRGALMQVNAGSLVGEFGPRVQDTAQWLLQRGLIHCLATDGHGVVPPRAPLLSPGVEAAARIVGAKRAEAMVTKVPERILAGEVLDFWYLH